MYDTDCIDESGSIMVPLSRAEIHPDKFKSNNTAPTPNVNTSFLIFVFRSNDAVSTWSDLSLLTIARYQ